MEACRRNVGCAEQKSNNAVGSSYTRFPTNQTSSVLKIPAPFRDSMMNSGMPDTSYVPQHVVSRAPPLVTMV